MAERRKVPKRRGKQSHRKLDIKQRDNKSLKNTSEQTAESDSKKKINNFKAKGFTLLKGKKISKKTKFNIRVISASVLLLIIIFGIIIFANAPTGVVEYIGSKFALMKSGTSFPAEYDFSTNSNICYSGGSLLVVTETDLKCFNKTGNLIYTRQHGFSDPIIKTSKIRTLIYGLNESFYRIETPEKEVAFEKTENNMPIVSADIADCGTYAIVTEGTDKVAVITVYDKDGKKIYKYHSSNNYITAVSVSENGKKIALVSMSTEKAEFVSKISVYDLSETEPIFEKELKGEVVYDIEYSNSKDLCVITDKKYINIKNDEITASINYSPEYLKNYEISDDYIVLYNTADSHSLKGNVYILSKDGDVESKISVEGNVNDISAADKKLYTLGERVNEYDFDGKLIKSNEIKNGAVKLSALSNGVCVLYSSGVDFIEEN